MNYRSEIDGLRALAVMPVILYHAGVPGLSGGFVGVDVFFVISGYLIATLLIEDMAQGRFRLLDFYERRARRILPALVVVILACLPFAWAWMTPDALRDFGQSVAATMVFASNVLFWIETDYFAPAAETKPLLHTWSLAVEEQFYLIFPLLLAALWHQGPRRVARVFGMLAAVSFVIMLWGMHHAPAANFFLPVARMWELFAGVLCAIVLRCGAVAPNRWLAGAGLAAILAAVALLDTDMPFPSGWSLLPVGGAAAVILFAPGTIVARLLSMRVLTGLGLISYSAYLWHQPLFAFARLRSLHEPSLPMMLALTALALVLAGLTWAYVEQPFRRRAPRRVIFAGAGVSGVALVALGATLSVLDGIPERRAPSGISYANFDEGHIRRINPGLSDMCRWGFTLDPACRTDPQPEVLLWGDSYAMHLAPGLLASDPKVKLVQQTMSACMPALGVSQVNAARGLGWAFDCMAFNDQVLVWLAEQKHIRYVVLSSPLHILLRDVKTRSGPVPAKQRETVIAARFDQLVQAIRATGKQPVLIGPPPRNGQDIGACLTTATLLGTHEGACDFPRADFSPEARAATNFLRHFATRMPVIALDGALCASGRCDTKRDGVFLYRDGGHLSVEGSALLGKQLNLMHLVRARADAFYGSQERRRHDRYTDRPSGSSNPVLQCRDLRGAHDCLRGSAG